MAKIFVICPVRNADEEVSTYIRGYIEGLEDQGHQVHWPPRDTDQDDPHGIQICMDNCDAIIAADEVHIWSDPGSKGSIFDRGMVYALRGMGLSKKVVWINKMPPFLGYFRDFFDSICAEDIIHLQFDKDDPEFLFKGGMVFAILRLGMPKKIVIINEIHPTEYKSFENLFLALADGRDISN